LFVEKYYNTFEEMTPPTIRQLVKPSIRSCTSFISESFQSYNSSIQTDGFELYDELEKKDNDVKVCFLTASELYYEEFRRKEYRALDKNLFYQKTNRQ
jgi:hypothetical protein